MDIQKYNFYNVINYVSCDTCVLEWHLNHLPQLHIAMRSTNSNSGNYVKWSIDDISSINHLIGLLYHSFSYFFIYHLFNGNYIAFNNISEDVQC